MEKRTEEDEDEEDFLIQLLRRVQLSPQVVGLISHKALVFKTRCVFLLRHQKKTISDKTETDSGVKERDGGVSSRTLIEFSFIGL